MAITDVYVATASFEAFVDGERVLVQRGKTRVRDGHPILKGREHLFVPQTVRFDVEQATQAPGEKRDAHYECDECGQTAKSQAGLAAHRRSHD